MTVYAYKKPKKKPENFHIYLNCARHLFYIFQNSKIYVSRIYILTAQKLNGYFIYKCKTLYFFEYVILSTPKKMYHDKNLKQHSKYINVFHFMTRKHSNTNEICFIYMLHLFRLIVLLRWHIRVHKRKASIQNTITCTYTQNTIDDAKQWLNQPASQPATKTHRHTH